MVPHSLALVTAATLVALPAVAQKRAPSHQGTPANAYAAVDAHVDRTPAAAERSVEELARHLAQAGPDDRTRARAVFRWVTGNVRYDVRGFRTGDYGDLSPAGVLARREAVCTGYAQLAEALGRAMGLEIRVVRGWSKGYGYTTGQTFDGPTNHAWNAVRIDGAWHLMDPTWGAGYLGPGMEFVPHFQEHYFLTDPDRFVFDHLPVEPEWQLLERPITSEEYADLVYLRAAFFLTGLEVRSHARVRIAAHDRLRVTLGAPDDAMLIARLLDARSEADLGDRQTFVQVADGEAAIDVAFPYAGDYVLRLFAKRRSDEGSLRWALDYRIAASGGDPDAGFPQVFGRFAQTGAVLETPMTGTLAAGVPQQFRLRAPGALQVAVVASGEWIMLTADGDVWAGEATPPAGDVAIFAKYDEEGSFTSLLRYEAR
ncbi:MAG: transglutaminase domain-containing protein [Gemmatimonadales bacterium]|jgi:hypothetical protein